MILPDNILKRMSPEERKKLGKGGVTADEAQTVYSDGQEKQLQKDIGGLLNQLPHKPYVIQSPYGKKTLNPGQADFVICYRGYWLSLEAKCGKNKQSMEQIMDEAKVANAGGRYYVVRTCQEVREIFQHIDELSEGRAA